MSGKQHMTIGTGISIILSILAVYLGIYNVDEHIIIFIIGSIIGSYMPDIDAHNSKASQYFNKMITTIIILLVIFYYFGSSINISDSLSNLYNEAGISAQSKLGVIVFCVTTVLSKLSPHRIFTHKWFGTSLFLISIYLIGNMPLFYGFTIGYILHLVADRWFTKNGQFLKFFEFKLPLTDSKGKTSINW